MSLFHKRTNQFYAGLVLAIAIVTFFTLSLEVLRVVGFPKGNLDYLPAESTLYAYEWINNPTNEEVKNLRSQVGIVNLKRILDFETEILPQEVLKLLAIRNQKLKTIAGIYLDGEIHDVLVFTVEKSAQSQFTKDLKAINENLENYWYFTFKEDKVFLTQSQDAAVHLSLPNDPLTQQERYKDAMGNLPQRTFGKIYLGHDVLNRYIEDGGITGTLNQARSVIDIFGVTAGAVKIESDGVYVSTYTNPKDESEIKFPFIRQKYQAELLDYLPKNPDFIAGGENLTERLYEWLENMSKNSTQISKSIKNILLSYNLQQEALALLNDVLSEEYAIAFYDGEPVIAVNRLTQKEERQLTFQLERLAGFYDPKIISYLLEDGQVARQLVPNEDAQYIRYGDNVYLFELKDIDRNIYYWSKGEVSYMTTSQKLIDKLMVFEGSYAETDLYDQYQKVMPISDEVFQISREQVAAFLNLKRKDAPTITSALNYFDDGIQTVHLLAW